MKRAELKILILRFMDLEMASQLGFDRGCVKTHESNLHHNCSFHIFTQPGAIAVIEPRFINGNMPTKTCPPDQVMIDEAQTYPFKEK